MSDGPLTPILPSLQRPATTARPMAQSGLTSNPPRLDLVAGGPRLLHSLISRVCGTPSSRSWDPAVLRGPQAAGWMAGRSPSPGGPGRSGLGRGRQCFCLSQGSSEPSGSHRLGAGETGSLPRPAQAGTLGQSQGRQACAAGGSCEGPSAGLRAAPCCSQTRGQTVSVSPHTHAGIGHRREDASQPVHGSGCGQLG